MNNHYNHIIEANTNSHMKNDDDWFSVTEEDKEIVKMIQTCLFLLATPAYTAHQRTIDGEFYYIISYKIPIAHEDIVINVDTIYCAGSHSISFEASAPKICFDCDLNEINRKLRFSHCYTDDEHLILASTMYAPTTTLEALKINSLMFYKEIEIIAQRVRKS